MRSTGQSKTIKRKWSADIKTDSTFPPAGTFTKPGEEVARIMATKKVSPLRLGIGDQNGPDVHQSVGQEPRRAP
jgi:hypothetical protein